jgi:hypothetical protein
MVSLAMLVVLKFFYSERSEESAGAGRQNVHVAANN